jgi:Ca2+-binding EF-hand superfamily protein
MSDDPLRDRFNRIDSDADGKIDESEFAKLLDELGLGYTGIQVHAAFTAVDVNGSGRIELEELRAWWTSQ